MKYKWAQQYVSSCTTTTWRAWHIYCFLLSPPFPQKSHLLVLRHYKIPAPQQLYGGLKTLCPWAFLSEKWKCVSTHKSVHKCHGSFIHNSKKLGTTPMSSSGLTTTSSLTPRNITQPRKGTNHRHTNNLGKSPGNYTEEKNPISKGYMFYDSTHTALNGKTTAMENRLVVTRGYRGVGRKASWGVPLVMKRSVYCLHQCQYHGCNTVWQFWWMSPWNHISCMKSTTISR